MEHHYSDGTEPTILPHMRYCCDHKCQQGRICPNRSGIDDADDDNFAYWFDRIRDALAIVGFMAAFAFVIGYFTT